jgi:hypothetical protein
MVVSSKNLARSGLLSAASSTSTTVRAALKEDDKIIYLLAAAEACAGADPNTFPLDREINGESYIKPRSIGWWDSFAANELDGERWHKLLRVSRDTFQYLVDELTFDLKTNVPFSFSQTPNRVLTVPRQIAMSLNRLATGHSMFAISELFGVSEEKVTLTTRKFCRAVWKTLKPVHLSWPSNEEEMKKVIHGFKEKQGLFKLLWGN